MIQTIPLWKVTVTLPSREVVLWIHDMHISNVLRQVAAIQFTENGLEQPTKIVIGG